jgi:hypothetical protein
MSSLWDAAFIQILDRTGPPMLNLSGTPDTFIAHLDRLLLLRTGLYPSWRDCRPECQILLGI